MDTQDAYNNWAKTYDTVANKTRDLEVDAIESVLGHGKFESILEIGCGTGKNTIWLVEKCNKILAVDFSKDMLAIARQKINNEKVIFEQADITEPWNFEYVNLITCSLVLEHIADLSFIFKQAALLLDTGGQFYICELHPYKQLNGSRARFEVNGNLLHLDYFIHHISDYLEAAENSNFACDKLQEWFDNEDKNQSPRLVSYLFRKK